MRNHEVVLEFLKGGSGSSRSLLTKGGVLYGGPDQLAVCKGGKVRIRRGLVLRSHVRTARLVEGMVEATKLGDREYFVVW